MRSTASLAMINGDLDFGGSRRWMERRREKRTAPVAVRSQAQVVSAVVYMVFEARLEVGRALRRAEGRRGGYIYARLFKLS